MAYVSSYIFMHCDGSKVFLYSWFSSRFGIWLYWRSAQDGSHILILLLVQLLRFHRLHDISIWCFVWLENWKLQGFGSKSKFSHILTIVLGFWVLNLWIVLDKNLEALASWVSSQHTTKGEFLCGFFIGRDYIWFLEISWILVCLMVPLLSSSGEVVIQIQVEKSFGAY